MTRLLEIAICGKWGFIKSLQRAYASDAEVQTLQPGVTLVLNGCHYKIKSRKEKVFCNIGAPNSKLHVFTTAIRLTVKPK